MTTAWNGWFGLFGKIVGAPAVVFPTPGTIDVYVRGEDNRLWQKWWDGKKWNPSDKAWAPHEDGGFRLGSAPSVFAQGANFREVVVRGQDGHVYHKFWDGTKWSQWFGLGGTIKGAPSVTPYQPGAYDIYARGDDDRLWQKWWDGKKWNPSDADWAPHDDGNFRLGSSPCAISDGPNFRDVYVRGQDGGVYHKFWNGQTWSGWFGLGGQIKDEPAVVRVHPGFFDIYARGMDDRLWQKWWTGKQWVPSDLGWIMHNDGNDRIGGPPGVASGGDTLRDVYVRAPNGDAMHKFWNAQRHSYAPVIRADAAKSQKVDQAVQKQISSQQPGCAVAVIKNGQIVHLAGYGVMNLKTKQPITSETMFHIGSCGKQFTAVGIMMLQQEGKLAYDDHIGKHIPELSGFNAKVTLRRLLNHTSDVLELYDAAPLAGLTKINPFPTNADCIKYYVANKFPMNPDPGGPGDKYLYVNSEYDLLGSVIERLSGQSYADFFWTRIFRPFGMTDTWSFPDTSRLKDANVATGYSPDGTNLVPQSGSSLDGIVGSGSFYSSVFDLCAYEEALSKNYLVTAANFKNEACKIVNLPGGKISNYGFGWWVTNFAGKPCVDHDGFWTGFRGVMRRFTTTPLSVYILLNSEALDPYTLINDVSQPYV